MKKSLKDEVIVEAAHITEVYGPVQALENYLRKKSEEFLFIAHPFSYSSLKRSKAILYQKGWLEKESIGPKNVGPEILHYLKDVLFTVYSVWRLKRRTELFIGVDNLNAFVGIWLRRLKRVKKVIYYVIDYTPKRFDNRFLNLLYHRIDQFCVKRCDAVWNLSARISEIRERQGIRKERNMIVPVGVDLEQIKHASPDQILRRSLVCVSHLTESKGIQLIIDSMNEIVKNVPDAKLLIIGTGPYEAKLRAMVREKKLEGCIEFLGAMEHERLFEYLPRCGIGVATYTEDSESISYYADPTKPKEFLACGLPLIITRVPWIAQEVEEKSMGIAINYDKGELVGAVLNLLTDDKLYEICKTNALEYVSGLAWEKIYDRAFSRCRKLS